MLNNTYKSTGLLFVLAAIFAWVFLLALAPASAQTRVYSIDNLRAEVEINQDSSVTISEKLSYTFDGAFNGMFREITLRDRGNEQICENSLTAQCAGFEYINIDKVLVNGEEVDEGRYEISEVSDGINDRLRVQYEFDGAPVDLDNEQYTFEVQYTLLGAIGFTDEYALFYWNAIFEDRDVDIRSTDIVISYPGPVSLEEDQSRVEPLFSVDYNVERESASQINYSVGNIEPFNTFTLLQKINLDDISEPASLNIMPSPEEQTLTYEQFTIEIEGTQLVEGIPAGDAELEFSSLNFYSQSYDLDLESGEVRDLEVNLERTPLGTVVLFTIIFFNLLCCCLALLSPLFALFIWYARGRDAKNDKAIVPQFAPPEDMKTYMLGSIKDEKVDNKDITATIIDLAYRGHILIIEEEKKFLQSQDFTLKKLDTPDQLDEVEKDVMDMIFGKETEVKLSSLKEKAYLDLKDIRNDIYKQMVDVGYFENQPQNVRNAWLGVGMAVFFIGIGAGVGLTFLGIFTAVVSAALLGISIMIVSRFMPAKTELGAETLRNVRGFKMYLETAEKYTLQNLTPETFEKYLSYAIVFGVEEEWAKKFEDLYEGSPDWYQGQMDTFNTLLFVNALNSFSSSAATTVSSTPSSSSSSSGSGWSGGGGFSGGFSGGGFGGGGGGAW